MDIFLEQMVKRKRTAADYIKVIGCMVCVFGIIALSPLFLIPAIGAAIFAFSVLAIYFLYKLVCTINMEYEYTFTNGSMDVDKIINARNRKSILEINIRKIEMAGSKNNPAFAKYMADRAIKKVFAAVGKQEEGLCFILFQDKDGKNKMLLFHPNEELKNAIRMFNPQKVDFS